MAHDITTATAWVDAFVLMAFTEVASRLVTIMVRAYWVRQRALAAVTVAAGEPAVATGAFS